MTLPRRQKRLILVVDDDETVLDSLREFLSAHDFLVSTARDAGEAILELGAQRPDLILTDIYMPEGDGYELLRALRQFGDRVPVVAMSGRDRIGDGFSLNMAERLGAVAVIEKNMLAVNLVAVLTAEIDAAQP